MTKLGSIGLIAARDFCKEERTTIPALFAIAERSKEFRLMEEVERGARIRVAIERFGPFEAVADSAAKKDEKVSVWRLITRADLLRELIALADIRQGEKLRVTYEAI